MLNMPQVRENTNFVHCIGHMISLLICAQFDKSLKSILVYELMTCAKCFTQICVCREGHTTLVKELESQLDGKPGAVVLSVGGGGLLNGVVEGLRCAGWGDVPIIAMETVGAHTVVSMQP